MAARSKSQDARRTRLEQAANSFLTGSPVPCPLGCGGTAEAVRVSTAESGTGEVWMECTSCAQRERLEFPAPAQEEREQVDRTLQAGQEPLCPRHYRRVVLRRRGRQLLCPECGVRYRD
jgi:hypothetical protein